ncbi:hypothetical protein C8F01DRAFT_1244216 [Mycena amicta]|nr:hypothetical protein C8F01DRAFT_1244216 [Mycena amicta]
MSANVFRVSQEAWKLSGLDVDVYGPGKVLKKRAFPRRKRGGKSRDVQRNLNWILYDDVLGTRPRALRYALDNGHRLPELLTRLDATGVEYRVTLGKLLELYEHAQRKRISGLMAMGGRRWDSQHVMGISTSLSCSRIFHLHLGKSVMSHETTSDELTPTGSRAEVIKLLIDSYGADTWKNTKPRGRRCGRLAPPLIELLLPFGGAASRDERNNDEGLTPVDVAMKQ